MENSNLQIFENEEFGQIRTVTIDNEPWFVGKDVATALGYKDTSDALKKHVSEEDKLTRCFTDSGQGRKMYVVNESGLYALIFGSKLESAKRFKHWVTSEILPSIRKHGGYIWGQENMSEEELMARAILLSQRLIKEKEAKILALESEKKENAPKIEDWNALMDTKGTFSVLDLAHCIDIGRTTLFCMLRDVGICFKNERDENIPYEKPVHKDKFTTCIVNKNGKPCTQMRIYPKGIPYILKKLREHEYIDKATEKEAVKYFKDLEAKRNSQKVINLPQTGSSIASGDTLLINQ